MRRKAFGRRERNDLIALPKLKSTSGGKPWQLQPNRNGQHD
jgi:hypothetical protein